MSHRKSIATKHVGGEYRYRKALENVHLTGHLCEQSDLLSKLLRNDLIALNEDRPVLTDAGRSYIGLSVAEKKIKITLDILARRLYS